MFAPDEKSIFKSSKDSIKAEIDTHEDLIEASERLIDSLELDLKAKLSRLGIDLTRDQIRVITTRIDGDDLSKTLAIFDVAKQITSSLAALLEKNQFSSDVTVKYYGVHVVLSEMVAYSQELYIEKIQSLYLPALEQIDDQVESAIEFAEASMKKATSEDNRKIFAANVKSNEFAKFVVAKYKDILRDQIRQLRRSLKLSKEQITVAYSTYDTAAISANLVSVISMTQKQFDKILNLQVPKIVPFQSVELQSKFYEISNKMSSQLEN
jgi:DNA-binding transcriptional regulator YiaG